MSDSLTIRKIISKITSGEIRIPAFQRGFVWSPEQVAFLLDSIYKGFPIGSVLLWRTRERLEVEKNLGNFALPEPQKDYPIDYVLDGQQRLTSIFSVFQTDLAPENDDGWLDIYFNFTSDNDIHESRFTPLKKDDFDSNKYFPMNVMFDSVKYRQACEGLPLEIVEQIDKVQEKFKEAVVPIETMETEDRNHVAIVFERVNRAGEPLDTFQLLSAWSWSTEFDLQEEFTDLAEELEPFGFGDISLDKDLQLKCCSGVILGEASPQAIMSLKGADVRNNFEKIKNGIKGSIDFLQREFKFFSLRTVPYPAMIVSLTRFFASEKINGISYTSKQRDSLKKWFWKNCFSRRYSSGITGVHKQDLLAMDKLREDENYSIADFTCEIDESFFRNNQFFITAVNTKTFIALLASNNPRSFISGAPIDLSKVLKNCNKNEFHHVFPKKFLESFNIQKRDINSLANFCLQSSADNQKIKDKPPAEYKHLIHYECREQILKSALCPIDTLDINYQEFLDRRIKLLLEYSRSLIE